MEKQKVLGALVVMCVFAASASGNSITVRTRSSYGEAASTILNSATNTLGGVTIASTEFCSDALTNSGAGTCQVGYSFQITSKLPASGQSLTMTLPLPSGATLNGAGILTNDDGSFPGLNLAFSPFSQNDVLALSASAITFGTDSLGDPTFTFALPITLPGNGTGLALYMDVLNPNSSDGSYCYQAGTSCTAKDFPGLPVPEVTLTTAAVPEPASLSLLMTGLVGLGSMHRRRRRHS